MLGRTVGCTQCSLFECLHSQLTRWGQGSFVVFLIPLYISVCYIHTHNEPQGVKIYIARDATQHAVVGTPALRYIYELRATKRAFMNYDGRKHNSYRLLPPANLLFIAFW